MREFLCLIDGISDIKAKRYFLFFCQFIPVCFLHNNEIEAWRRCSHPRRINERFFLLDHCICNLFPICYFLL